MKHVLIVDDEYGPREALARVCELAGYRVSRAASVGEAELLARTERFDLVVWNESPSAAVSRADPSRPLHVPALAGASAIFLVERYGPRPTPDGARVIVKPLWIKHFLEVLEEQCSSSGRRNDS